MKELRIGAMACTACIAFMAFTCGRASAQQDVALTAMDYVEIQQLVNKLNFALDYCGNGARTSPTFSSTGPVRHRSR